MNKKITSAVAALALALTLGACSSTSSSYAQQTLDEVSGIKVEAENAGSDSSATTEGAITVEEGDTIVISPNIEKGSIHLTITSEDGKTTVFDDDVSGKVMFTQAAKPGVYNVTTSGNGATGEMMVFAQSQDELAKQNADLADAIEDATEDIEAEEKSE